MFGGAGKATESEKRLQRLEELRRDLYGEKDALTEYALNTLLSMLWMEAGAERLAVACALSDAPPLLGKAEAPCFAARLCYRVQTTGGDPLAAPPSTPLLLPKGAKLREWAEQAIAAIFTDALNTIKLSLRQAYQPREDALQRETDTCQSTLRLACRLKSPALVEPTLRLLRLFTPDRTREPGALARQTPELRSLAALYLAALSPDDLLPLWTALNVADAAPRRDLMPILDYFNDARAVPYLIKMLEKYAQWPDADMVGWTTVRALQRLRDRRALPVLRRLVAALERTAVSSSTRAQSGSNPALAQAARRAIEAIAHQRPPAERSFLLRPSSHPDAAHLLRPAQTTTDTDATELLRPETQE